MSILLITLYVLINIKGLDSKDLILTVYNTKIHDIYDYGNKDLLKICNIRNPIGELVKVL